MKHITGSSVCALLLLLTQAAWAAGREGALESGFVNPGHIEKPAWFKNSFLDLGEDVAEAAAAGKRVLLYFYQDGCPYCKRLEEANWGQRSIVDKTRRHFDVIAINMWGDREVTDTEGRVTTEKRFAAAMKVMFTPTLLFLDERGKVVLRINGYYPPHRFEAALDYVAGRHEARQSFREYYAARNPRPASGKLHVEPWYLQPPYRLRAADRPGDRPLLVLFEQPECAACDELHQDIFRRPESEALLRRFDVVLLNLWSKAPLVAPDGTRTTAAEWARALDVKYAPTMVFFDAAGREVFRAEAYLRAFHTQSALDYVASGAYREQPSFQRFIQARADRLRAQGVEVDLWR